MFKTNLVNIVKQLKQKAKSQCGAMFGMDARVALIIASVLAATGGITVMSKLERDRTVGAERGLELLVNALENHYKTISINKLAGSLDELFQNGLLDDSTLVTDPWGNQWQYTFLDRKIRISDVEVTVHYATIHSLGKNGLDETPTPFTPTDWDNWTALQDDIGIKYSTIQIENARVEEYRGRGKLIIDKLSAVEAGNYMAADALCSSTEAPEWCTKPKDYSMYNYLPPSNADNALSADDYYALLSGNSQVYISGDPTSMEQLMSNIGLPRAFAKDPWGRTLFYNSNATFSQTPPFTGSVWYE